MHLNQSNQIKSNQGSIKHKRRHASTSKSHILLDLLDGLCWIQALGTSSRAVEDGVAPVQAHAVVEHLPPLGVALVARVVEPAVRLQEDGRTEVLLAVPPVGGARRRTACAEDAFVEPVELFAVRGRLPVLFSLGNMSAVKRGGW